MKPTRTRNEPKVTVTVVVRGDARPFARAIKTAEARLTHLNDSRVGDALHRAMTREAVVRKSLGEFER